MELINTTGRYIIMSNERGNVRKIIHPGEERARVKGAREDIDSSVTRFRDATIVGLPNPREAVYFIVTSKVAHLTERDDVVIPEFHEGAMINGRYVGVRRFLAINRSSSPKPPGDEEDNRIG